jgi:general secretion pathway protein G
MKRLSERLLRNEKGMTLIEIMIVLLIIGTLLSVLGQNIMSRYGTSQVRQAKIQMGELGKALDMFYTDCGFYPPDLNALVTAPADCKNWGPEPYLKKLQKDPWNNDFTYETKGSSYVLKSMGKDRKEGGSGNDADISSEDL